MSVATSILGIDYGRSRVGLAYAGEDSPVRLRTLANSPEMLQEIALIVAEREINTIVVGLPRNTEGDDTEWTSEVRRFIDQLTIAFPVLTVVTQDEFATSSLAKERLSRLDQREQKHLLDQEAAVILLEDYIREHTA